MIRIYKDIALDPEHDDLFKDLKLKDSVRKVRFLGIALRKQYGEEGSSTKQLLDRYASEKKRRNAEK